MNKDRVVQLIIKVRCSKILSNFFNVFCIKKGKTAVSLVRDRYLSLIRSEYFEQLVSSFVPLTKMAHYNLCFNSHHILFYIVFF